MGMSVGGADEYNSEINVTPMVDVMLVLLSIFMVVTPLLQRSKDDFHDLFRERGGIALDEVHQGPDFGDQFFSVHGY